MKKLLLMKKIIVDLKLKILKKSLKQINLEEPL